MAVAEKPPLSEADAAYVNTAPAAGVAPTSAIDGVRPPLWGSRKIAAARTLERWTPRTLRDAAEFANEAIYRTRIMPTMAAVLARDVLLRIVSQSAGRGR